MDLQLISAVATSISTLAVILGIAFTVRQLRLLDAGRHGEVVRWIYDVWRTQDAREAHKLVREINALDYTTAQNRYDNFTDRERYLFTFVYQLIELAGILYKSGAIHEDEVFGYLGIVVAKWNGNMGRIVHNRYADHTPAPMGIIFADNLYRNYDRWTVKTHGKLFRQLGGNTPLFPDVDSPPIDDPVPSPSG